MKVSKQKFLALFITILLLFSLVPFAGAVPNTTGLFLDLKFNSDAGLTMAGAARTENGVLVLTGAVGTYATVEIEDLDEKGDAITIAMDARLLAAISGTNRTMPLSIGIPAADSDHEETAIYVYAANNALYAGIANGAAITASSRVEINVSGAANALASNAWRNVVVTYDSDAGGTLTLFVNGAKVAQSVNVGIDLEDIVTAAGAQITFGLPTKTGTTEFRGHLNNLKIWNSILSDREIWEVSTKSHLEADLDYLRPDTDPTIMYYEQWIHNPVVHDVMLWPNGFLTKYPISWVSDDPNILSIRTDANNVDYFADFNESAVDSTADKTVILTATIAAPDPASGADAVFTASRDLVLTVPSLATRRQMDLDALELTTPDDVRDNLPLITQSKNGSKISWRSSNPAVITDTPIGDGTPFQGGGVVTRPAEGAPPVRVTLTATVAIDGLPGFLTKNFDVNVTPISKGVDDPRGKYLMTYYAEGHDWDQDGETTEEMYFAVSEDGVAWVDLNVKTRANETRYTEPILKSTVGDMGLRDAHFVRSPKGDKFYALATDLHAVGTALTREGSKAGYSLGGNNFNTTTGNRTLVVWESDDLANWGKPRLVRCNFDFAGNTYAPESIWDPDKQAYLVYWNARDISIVDENGNYTSNNNIKIAGIYKCYTRDFNTFTEPEFWYGYEDIKDALIYTANKDILDTHITFDESDGYFYRFAATNRVFVDRSRSLDGPWEDVAPIRHGNSNFEAPTTYQLPDGKWMLLLDNYATYVPFSATKTGNLRDFMTEGDWTRGTLNHTLATPRPKHGMVMNISDTEYNALVEKFGTANQPPAPPPEAVGVYAGAKTSLGDKAEYTFSAEDMLRVNLIDITFTVSGDMVSGSAAVWQGLNDFQVFKPDDRDIQWTDLGNNQWQGRIILGTYSGTTKTGSMDVGKLLLDTVKLGGATLTIAGVKVYGIDVVSSEIKSRERAVTITPVSATTEIYSVYDLDGDNKVDNADLSLAFYYYQAKQGDVNWNSAKAADVNGDSVVDMTDLIAIYINYIQ